MARSAVTGRRRTATTATSSAPAGARGARQNRGRRACGPGPAVWSRSVPPGSRTPDCRALRRPARQHRRVVAGAAPRERPLRGSIRTSSRSRRPPGVTRTAGSIARAATRICPARAAAASPSTGDLTDADQQGAVRGLDHVVPAGARAVPGCRPVPGLQVPAVQRRTALRSGGPGAGQGHLPVLPGPPADTGQRAEHARSSPRPAQAAPPAQPRPAQPRPAQPRPARRPRSGSAVRVPQSRARAGRASAADLAAVPVLDRDAEVRASRRSAVAKTVPSTTATPPPRPAHRPARWPPGTPPPAPARQRSATPPRPRRPPARPAGRPGPVASSIGCGPGRSAPRALNGLTT